MKYVEQFSLSFSDRGVGMMIGIEMVMDKESKKPAKETAEILTYK